MALSAATVWEVRPLGSDTNGGGFVTGAAGTDWSQQNAAQYSVTDGVTAGTTTITSATAAFGTDVVGNLIYVAGGTGSVTAGWYQIMSRTNATTIVVDRSTGLTAGTGVTLKIGGALATINQLGTNMSAHTAGSQAYIKGGTDYTTASQITFNNGSTSARNTLIGYTTTRTDEGMATLKATAAITMIANSSTGYVFRNLIFDGNTATGTNAILRSVGGGAEFYRCIIKNWSGYGITLIGNEALTACEITGCGTTAAINITGANVLIDGCYLHGNTVPAIQTNSGVTLVDSIVTGNTGATTDGVSITSNITSMIEGCVIASNGRDGVRIAGGLHARPCNLKNNIIMSNGGYGINQVSGVSTMVLPGIRNNAYYNNTTAERFGFVAEVGAVTLTGDPFTNAAGADYSLNDTAGRGAACKAAGRPGLIFQTSTTGYRDIGVAQHADPVEDTGGASVTYQGFWS